MTSVLVILQVRDGDICNLRHQHETYFILYALSNTINVTKSTTSLTPLALCNIWMISDIILIQTTIENMVELLFIYSI